MRQVGQAGKQAGKASDPRHCHILFESRSPAWASSGPLAGRGVVVLGEDMTGRGDRPGLSVEGWHGHAVRRQLPRQRETDRQDKTRQTRQRSDESFVSTQQTGQWVG